MVPAQRHLRTGLEGFPNIGLVVLAAEAGEHSGFDLPDHEPLKFEMPRRQFDPGRAIFADDALPKSIVAIERDNLVGRSLQHVDSASQVASERGEEFARIGNGSECFGGAVFDLAQASAAVAAMTSNFFLNNLFTYRDRRLHGVALLRGLFTFYAICALGAVANVGIAGYIFSRNEIWWLAGLAGVVVGSVWNYAVSSVFTWKQK